MIPRGPLNFLSFFSAFFTILSLPGLHSCFRAGGFFLQSSDERAALSSPAGRSVKDIALAVHCPTHEIKKAEREKGSIEESEKRIWKQRFKEEGRKEQRIQMTDKVNRQSWRSEGETEREPMISALLLLLLTTPLIPGMMSAFIDFVKPFSMLLPMCLQDSKSCSIRGWGLWGEIRGETSKLL